MQQAYCIDLEAFSWKNLMVDVYGYASGQGLDAQEKQLRAAGAKRMFREAANHFGGEQFNRALSSLFKGTLLVTSVDRLARSTRDLFDKLKKIDELRTRGPGFRFEFRSLSAGETWADTTVDDWRFTLKALAHVVGIERQLARARIRDGQERAKIHGVKIGRKPKLTAQQKREAIKRRDSGETYREIAASYDVSAATISRLRPTT
jgi:DNA invertase Pin-like site-specific DNA recombinase